MGNCRRILRLTSIQLCSPHSAGEREVALPNLGMETLNHVHAWTTSHLAFVKAISNWSVSAGQSFHVVSSTAVTMRGYAEAVAEWFGKKAQLRFVPWEDRKQSVSENEASVTWDHIARSPNCSYRERPSDCSGITRDTVLSKAVRESLQRSLQ